MERATTGTTAAPDGPPDRDTAIAVIGSAGRFPGADTAEALWDVLCDGRETISRFSPGQMQAAGVPTATAADPRYVPARGVVAGAERFDAAFFGYPPGDADLLDPQQRVLLECAWEALENAGYGRGVAPATGVFAGAMLSTYLLTQLMQRTDVLERYGLAAVFQANQPDQVAARIAYKLNLHGPAITVQTACSTSLVAVHLAGQSLLAEECDMALAGGVCVRVPQHTGYLAVEGGVESPDGHCRPFDQAAAGTVFGNGAGMVVLKRLRDAEADGDPILAVVLGSAVNNDGADKVGFTAPGVLGQLAVIEEALAAAGIDPATVGFVQAHGTGTPLGDPIEVEALQRSYGAAHAGRRTCALGSVKANIGHLDTAAGIAGLLATVHAVRTGLIPPHPSFQAPIPGTGLGDGALYVPTRLEPWPLAGGPRRAAVSAFGVGGTNAHLLLQEPPQRAPRHQPATPVAARPHLMVLSARTSGALQQMTDRLADHLQATQPDLADVAHTLRIGRAVFPYRRAVVAADTVEAVARLRAADTAAMTGRAPDAPVEPVFLFPGQGIRLRGLDHLYRRFDVFRNAIEECTDHLAASGGVDLRTAVVNPAALPPDWRERTSLVQPALFAIGHALAALLETFGVRPRALCGHSVGEYVAASRAGVFSVADGIRLTAARGRLMEDLPAGAMTAVPLTEKEALRWAGDALDVAAVNGAQSCVLSGTPEAVAAVERALTDAGTRCLRLPTRHAFHSRHVEAAADRLAEVLDGMALHRPSTPLVSNVTGGWLDPEEARTAAYWVRHLREPVRFVDCVATLAPEGGGTFVECGLGRTLGNLVTSGIDPTAVVVSPCARAGDGAFDEALGRLWTLGTGLDVDRLPPEEGARRIALPPYPFERSTHWLGAPGHQQVAAADDAPTVVPGAPPDGAPRDAVVRRVSWQEDATVPDPDPLRSERLTWLVFAHDTEAMAPLTALLRERGQIVTVVRPGDGFRRVSRSEYEIDPTSSGDYEELLRALRSRVLTPSAILHGWQLDTAQRDTDAALDAGFLSLVRLAKALVAARMLHRIGVTVLSSGAVDVAGADAVDPLRAVAFGAATVLPREHTNLAVTALDVPPDWSARRDTLLRVLHEALHPADPVVAVRGGRRWVRRLVEEPPTGTAPGVTAQDVVLITGGLGGIGLRLAERLAETTDARIALLSRRPDPRDATDADGGPGWDDTTTAARIDRLAAAAAGLRVVRADVADDVALARALDEIRGSLGPPTVLVHAAGIAGGGTVELRGIADMRGVLAPKVQGLRNLFGALHADEAGRVLLCSSLASVFGPYGQADYAAANCFLDAFAAQQTALGHRSVVSVSWDSWSQIGMAVTTPLPADLAAARAAELRDALTPEQGMRAMERCLAAAPGHLAVLRAGTATAARSTADSGAAGEQPPGALSPPIRIRHGRPDSLTTAYVEPSTDVERRLAAIWEEYLNLEPVGVEDDFLELGGHSLLGAQLVAAIRETFGVDLPISVLFQHPRVADLALEIEEHVIREFEEQP